MNMTILTTNFEKLNDELYNNSYDYLIMHKQTLKLFEDGWGQRYIIGSDNYPSYRGVPIAICDKFPVGEIDLVKRAKD